MRKIKIKLTVLVMLIIITFSATVFEIYAIKNIGASTDKKEPLPTYYTLTFFGDKMAVFSSEKKEPIYTFEVNKSDLSPNDQITLQNGITADSYGEIMLRAEDYE